MGAGDTRKPRRRPSRSASPPSEVGSARSRLRPVATGRDPASKKLISINILAESLCRCGTLASRRYGLFPLSFRRLTIPLALQAEWAFDLSLSVERPVCASPRGEKERNGAYGVAVLSICSCAARAAAVRLRGRGAGNHARACCRPGRQYRAGSPVGWPRRRAERVRAFARPRTGASSRPRRRFGHHGRYRAFSEGAG